MKYFKKLIGEKCYLSPVSLEDVEKYTEWVNDMETGLYVLYGSNVIDTNKETEILSYLIKHNVIMAIIEKETNKPVGFCGLHDRNEIHRTTTFGISIGDKSYWGQGIGTEATMLLLDYAFNMLNLNSVLLEVIDYNKRAIKCYEKCGFTFIGKKRQAIFIAGVFHDTLLYDILASDFTSLYIKPLYEKSVSQVSRSSNITLE
jgi:RimJ/RimL family protein N-acetyltransferase